MRRIVAEQELGFVATTRPDGTPAVSPKGTLRVWSDTQLVFLHLHSPGTVANLAANPAVEVNVVDPILRKGWRFAGRGTVYSPGPAFHEILSWYDRPASATPAKAVVIIDVDRAEELVSPVYDSGAGEDEVVARWRQHYSDLDRARHRDAFAEEGMTQAYRHSHR